MHFLISTHNFFPIFIDISISTYIYCNDSFLYHHQSTNRRVMFQLCEHILLMSTHSEIELLQKSFTIYDPPQVLV